MSAPHRSASARHPVAYVADMCRCPECCTANTTYEQKRVRAHVYGLPVLPAPHDAD